MKNRCYKPNNNRYHRYGAQGIKVCKRWHDFSLFLEDMGIRPAGTSLDRVNGNKNYTKSNCRWSTPKTQARQNGKLINYNGKKLNLTDWARELGIGRATLSARLRKGIPVEQAFTMKVGTCFKKRLLT